DGVKRLPKKRVALLIGYCGTGYSGMQIQPGEAETIEGELFQALVKAGAVSSDNSNDHRKVDVQRAARTDAGVHAAGNCVSLKMIINPVLPPEHETLKSLVNSYLPKQIRMWGFVRCIKSFDARTSCDSRIYEYLLPSYCLLPPTASSSLAKQLDSSSPGWREGLGPGTEFVNAAPPLVEVDESAVTTDTPARRGEYERRRNWRVDEGTMGRFRGLMSMYLGSHNFHNYTVGRPFHDRAVKRHMIQIDVLDPKVYGEIEWISVQIHGQSFMLHQIRKMISMAVLACRTGTPAKIISETYGSKRIHIPKAPPLGLLLEAPQFKTYNKRIRENSHQYDHEPVDYTSYAEEIMAFKVKYIYERLRQEELERHVFQKWTRQMDGISDNILRFLNTNGIIPDEATIPTGPTPKKRSEVEEVGSDEEVDAEQLKRGELEG
ncbi:hypothetical protein TREMEDRAFT_14084, partial [Tremella mesenterica DSM 1558]|uniref:uncharacterized protein n=1 Tax=Tremella mesenterica (strain ATCC 24925 / CBS 8224 / DSM 1558 / NBRC 9311 / NRRL Y-6157 / RJB 2259-6 / UBC 559-6) TaxID=578456 RepID=UPI0003F48FF6